MNRIQKGRRIERELETCLRKCGYITWRPAWNKWQSKDIFRFADIIALATENAKPIFKGNETMLFIQVKSNPTHFYQARKKIRDFLNGFKIKARNEEGILFITALRIKNQPNVYRLNIYDVDGDIDFVKDFNTGKIIINK